MSTAAALSTCQERSQVLAKIKRIVINNLNLDLSEDQIDDDSPLFGTGLGLDSIDALDLVIGIEEGFSIKVGEDELYVFKSVNSLVDYIMERQASGEELNIRKHLGMEARPLDTPGILEPGVKEIFTALRTSSLLFESRQAIFRFPEGEETLAALGGVISGKLLTLEPNRIRHTALLDGEGRIVDLVYVVQFETHYWVLATSGNAEAAGLLRGLPVPCEEVTDAFRCIVMEGPYSWSLAKQVFGFEVLGLSYQRFIDLDHAGTPVTLARLSTTGEYGFRAYVPAPQAERVLKDLRENGAVEFLEVSDQARLGQVNLIAAMEMRMPIAGLTVERGGSLFENELRWMIDFSNPRITDRLAPVETKLVGILIKGGDPAESLPRGTEITLAGNTVATLQSSVYSPSMERQIGYASFLASYAYADMDGFEVKGRPELSITTVSTPFLLPASSRVQMQ